MLRTQIAANSDAHREALVDTREELQASRAMLDGSESLNSVLSASEGRLRLVLESATDIAIVTLDKEGLVTGWNVGARNILGWGETDIVGRSASCVWTPEDRAAGVFDNEMRVARDTGRAADERWHSRRDGSRFWASGEMMSMREGDGTLVGYLKILRDRTEAREGVERLAAKEAYWRSLFARLQEGLAIGEMIRDRRGKVVDWRYIDVNPAWGPMMGMEPGDVVGHTLREAFPDVEADWIALVASCVESGVPTELPRRPGHGDLWYEGHAYQTGEDQVALIFTDVTRRVREERRRESLLKLGDRLRDDEASPCSVVAGVIRDALGVDGGDYHAVPGGIGSTHAGPDRPTDRRGRAGKPMGGVTVVVRDVETDHRTRHVAATLAGDGVRAFVDVPVVEEGRTVALLSATARQKRDWTVEDVAFLREVADRTRAAMRRREIEREVRELAGSLEMQVERRTRERDRLWQLSADLMVVAGPDGVMVATNPAWHATLGWDAADLTGKPFADLVHPDDRGAAGEAVSMVSPSSRIDIRCLHRDGGHRWINWTGVPGEGVVVGVGRDVTLEREATREREGLEAQLRQAQKMEAVGQLTGGIAHDFNNLLTGITGSMDLVRRRLSQGRIDEVHRYVDLAMASATRAASLTHRLLAFSRRQTLDPRPVDPVALVGSMEELLRRTLGEKVELDVAAHRDPWMTRCDFHQLENAILNLCINARDAMPDGGRLTVRTDNVTLDAHRSRERDLPPGEYVSIAVVDTGTGMPAEVVAQAFDPFFTTKPIGQGTGLGLSMIHGFARQSGGQARIVSEVGAGTTVEILMPRDSGSDAADKPAAVGPPRPAPGGGTVLVVDDEPTVRALVCEALAEVGYATIEAGDGSAGLGVLNSDARVDLLLTDVGLPGGMNGRQVADAGRVLRPGMRVLFITGYAEGSVMGDGTLDEGMHLVTKPFALDALTAKVQDILNGSDARREA